VEAKSSRGDEVHIIERELARLVRAVEAARQSTADGTAAMDRAAYLLLDLLATGHRSVGDLSSALHLDQSTVTRQVSALVSRGLARRGADPHGGRAAVVEMTPDGADALDTERAARARRVGRTIASWSDHDRAELARLLVKLNGSLDDRLRGARLL
jgi:DNA-binding MarR family transcriptional regulator